MLSTQKLREIDTAHNTKVLSLMQDGQQYKTWCYAAQQWATVTRTGETFAVKFGRKAQTMTLADAVSAIVTASQG